MRLFKIGTFLLYIGLLSLPGLLQASEPLSPAPFEAEYSLYSKGLEVAKITRTFKAQGDDTYVYESHSQTTGMLALFRDDKIVERSHWRHTDNGFQPIEYVYQHDGSKKTRDVHINFNWSGNEVRMRVNDERWRMELEPGTLDKMLYQLAMMRDLEQGINKVSYRVADGGKMKTYTFETFGNESVHTPYGDFKALKVERYRDDRERETILWCVEELNYLPVKVVNIEPDGLKTTALLQSYKKLEIPSTARSAIGLDN